MMNRTVGIALTIITALCCGCLAIFSCIFGGLIAAGQPLTTTLNGVETQQIVPVPVGLALLCVSVIFIAIPIAVGFFTLRKKPADALAPLPVSESIPPSEPLPPTS
jgi:hypothetical protein